MSRCWISNQTLDRVLTLHAKWFILHKTHRCSPLRLQRVALFFFSFISFFFFFILHTVEDHCRDYNFISHQNHIKHVNSSWVRRYFKKECKIKRNSMSVLGWNAFCRRSAGCVQSEKVFADCWPRPEYWKRHPTPF